MKRIISPLLFLFSLLVFQNCKWRPTEFVTKETKVADHPRLLLSKAEEENFKKKVATDSTWSAIHNLIIHESDEMIAQPVTEYKLEGFRLLEQSRACRKKVLYLSYSWRMTHNQKYLDRAEKELLAVSSFKDWNPSHFLDVAEMTMAVAIGYDWLYFDLSKSTLATLRNAILKKGIEPSLISKNNWWLTESSNWNQVCNASMTFGALALYEDQPELAREIINRSIESIQRPMKEYDPDGAYPEGYEYWRYGTTFNVYFIDALEKAFGSSFGLMENSGFAKTANYLAHMVGPTALNFNYSDCSSTCLLNPAMFWFAHRQKDNSLLYSEKLVSRDKEKISAVRDLPMVLIWGAETDFKNMTEPRELIWTGQGKNPVALMRSSWGDDAIYIGIKGGSPGNYHGHMDVGSFVMDALGERWAMDFGAQNYNSLESKGIHLFDMSQKSKRWEVFRYNNLAHNTLTINKELQRVKGYASIIQSTSQKNFIGATLDLSKVYDNVSSLQRGAAIIDRQYAVIRDEIELQEPSKIQWTMLTAAHIKIISNNVAELTQNNKTLLLKVVEPEVTFKMLSTQSPNDFDEPNPNTSFIVFEISGKANTKIDLTVLLIPQGSKKMDEKKIPALNEWRNAN